MPLLTRMVATPMSVDIGPGAVRELGPLLADRRISTGGRVAVVVGPGLGEEVADLCSPQLGGGEFMPVEGGSLQSAIDLGRRLRHVGPIPLHLLPVARYGRVAGEIEQRLLASRTFAEMIFSGQALRFVQVVGQ